MMSDSPSMMVCAASMIAFVPEAHTCARMY